MIRRLEAGTLRICSCRALREIYFWWDAQVALVVQVQIVKDWPLRLRACLLRIEALPHYWAKKKFGWSSPDTDVASTNVESLLIDVSVVSVNTEAWSVAPPSGSFSFASVTLTASTIIFRASYSGCHG